MPKSKTRGLQVTLWMGALLLLPHATRAAEVATSQPAERTFTGTIASLDLQSRSITVNWRHPRARGRMPLAAQIGPSAQVLLDGKPAAVTDLKVGDLVQVTGRPATVQGNNQLVLNRIEKLKAPATSTAPAASSAPAGGGVKAADPKLDAILTRLESKGDEIDNIQADIIFTKIDPVLEDKQVFKGILRFKQDKPNPRFYIEFRKFIQEGVERDKKEWHIFDGEYYIEAREKTHTVIKRQIVRPGEPINVFRIGQGPFPLPFGQKKAEILDNFDCRLVPPGVGDPPNADHLECTPKPESDMARKYGKIDFFIDRELNLPVMVQTTEKAENVQVKAEFPVRSVQINRDLPGSALNLPDLGRDYGTPEVIPLAAPAAP